MLNFRLVTNADYPLNQSVYLPKVVKTKYSSGILNAASIYHELSEAAAR